MITIYTHHDTKVYAGAESITERGSQLILLDVAHQEIAGFKAADVQRWERSAPEEKALFVNAAAGCGGPS